MIGDRLSLYHPGSIRYQCCSSRKDGGLPGRTRGAVRACWLGCFRFVICAARTGAALSRRSKEWGVGAVGALHLLKICHEGQRTRQLVELI